MDEPTNHLDLESVSALAEGLSAFPGTVFIVSHDRDLVSQVATRIVAFTPDGIVDFKGPYEEYLQSGNSGGERDRDRDRGDRKAKAKR